MSVSPNIQLVWRDCMSGIFKHHHLSLSCQLFTGWWYGTQITTLSNKRALLSMPNCFNVSRHFQTKFVHEKQCID